VVASFWFHRANSAKFALNTKEEAMAKGQMRSNKEKKKPKAEWNKKKKGNESPSAYASQYAADQAKPNQNPFAKKG
jgi:hypothetical protein